MQFRLFREGKGWVAIPPGFHDIEISPFGYAATPEGAVSALLASPEFAELAAAQGWELPNWTASDSMDAFEAIDASDSTDVWEDVPQLYVPQRAASRIAPRR